MFQDAFKPLTDAEAQDFLRASGMTSMAPATTRVLQRSLPFYKGYRLIEVSDASVHPPRAKSFVQEKNSGQVTPLDWTNEPVYALNKAAPIVLTEETVTAYAKFFFTYIKGKHGRFLIIDNPDEIDWKDEPPPAGRKALAKMIEPLQIVQLAGNGDFHLQASMIFKDSLFSAKITVQKDGHVVLSDEELVVEDIPVRDDVTGL